MPKKGERGLGQFADLRGWLGKKEWGFVFERGGGGGGEYPNAHYELGNNLNCDFNLVMPMSSLLISIKKKHYLAIDWLLIIAFDVVRR